VFLYLDHDLVLGLTTSILSLVIFLASLTGLFLSSLSVEREAEREWLSGITVTRMHRVKNPPHPHRAKMKPKGADLERGEGFVY